MRPIDNTRRSRLSFALLLTALLVASPTAAAITPEALIDKIEEAVPKDDTEPPCPPLTIVGGPSPWRYRLGVGRAAVEDPPAPLAYVATWQSHEERAYDKSQKTCVTTSWLCEIAVEDGSSSRFVLFSQGASGVKGHGHYRGIAVILDDGHCALTSASISGSLSSGVAFSGGTVGLSSAIQ